VSDFECRVCSSNALEPVAGYAQLPRVTSDCKPWPAGGTMTVCQVCGASQKLPDETWFGEIDRIYKAYQIYKLSSGSEQVIFDATGGSAPRSHALVDFVVKNASPGAKGALIDIGCGNGAALANFSRALPGWTMSGTDLSDAPLETLQSLPNFGAFYKDEPRNIRERFDIVTMIHALEHMPDPKRTLEEAAALLNPGGRVFVEIPNVETSPFDLLIADHMMHFSPAHLGYLAQRAGLKVSALRDDVLPKEITMLAGLGGGEAVRPKPERNAAIVARHVSWLMRLVESARQTAAKAGAFGIFGTSISGMWLYGALGKDIAFFVDEDRTRVGNTYEGKPIVAPTDVPEGASVFLPLHLGAAASIRARLDGVGRGRFVEPPPFDVAR
jgi:SAM-dependent methyltransferase